jgi:probable HAF family extracellular repeat protein
MSIERFLDRLCTLALIGLGVAAGVVSLNAGADGNTATSYAMVEIAPLFSGLSIEPVTLSEANQVVGNADTPDGIRGFYWDQASGTRNLGVLAGGTDSGANAINAAGKIVGWSVLAGGQTHAVLYEGSDRIDLHELVGPGTLQSSALDINGDNQIVGWSETAEGRIRAYLYDLRFSRRTELTLADALNAIPYDIDDQNRIVGTVELGDGRLAAVRWDCMATASQTSCTAAVVPSLGGPNSGAYRVKGDAVIGTAETPLQGVMNSNIREYSNTTSGFRTQASNGNAAGILPGDVAGELRAINAAGVMVGMSVDAQERTRAVVATADGARDLNELAATSDLKIAADINDAGAILAIGASDDAWHGYLLTAASGGEMVSPSDGAELPGATASFAWTAGAGVSEFHLYVGSTLGGYDLYEGAQGTALTRTVSGIPTDGRTVYVRLWSKVGSRFVTRDYAYKAKVPTAAELTAPADSSTLPSSSVTFEWDTGVGVTDYYLYVGTTIGGYDIYQGSQGTSRSRTVSGIPTDGQRVHVTLWSRINGVFQIRRAVYIAADGRAAVTLPSPSSVLTSSTETFQWAPGVGVSSYHLYVGSSLGAFDIYDGAQGTSKERSIGGIPTDGRTIHVRLWSKFTSGALRYRDYSYTATTLASSPAGMTAPANGNVLSGASTTFMWSSGVGPTQYYLYVGTSPGGYDIHNASHGLSQSALVTGLPINGSPVYATLWSRIGGTWQTRSYDYLAFDGRAAITSPAPFGTLPGRAATLAWTSGTNVSEYHLYVGTTLGGYASGRGSTGHGRIETLCSRRHSVLRTRLSFSQRWRMHVTKDPPIRGMTRLDATTVASHACGAGRASWRMNC